MNRLAPRDVMRWALGGLLLALMISVAPEYWAAEQLPRQLWLVRAFTIIVPIVLSVLLYRARHESPLRQFPLVVALTSTMMFEAVLKVGPSARIVAMLLVWAAVVWIEWRRLVEEERRFA